MINYFYEYSLEVGQLDEKDWKEIDKKELVQTI
jgi:hypothetical protein